MMGNKYMKDDPLQPEPIAMLLKDCRSPINIIYGLYVQTETL